MHNTLDERQWRVFLATEALKAGAGGISHVARLSKADRKTVRKGISELNTPNLEGRVRRKGGGRKKRTETDPKLVTDLEALVEPKGDPMSLIRWTTKSLAHLVTALENKKHIIKKSALAVVLAECGFSLKANKKNIEGISHPDRDLQFQHIQKTCTGFEKKRCPIVSVDCKKKELIGNFRNHGREWQPRGKNTVVNVYDFINLGDGKAAPYGVYDTVKNTGFVNVGVDHDTASFAVESIRRWWKTIGKILYPKKTELLITSDGGGSNGVRNRLWKKELQQLANETGLSITVNHLPPATSKWNKIEHRLFSYISINWRGKPLTSLETIIELLSHTTTKQGLTVTAVVDKNSYPTGIKVSDAEMAQINIARDPFHGEWNYTITPQ
ncbi:MAG: ISAzo13 family transposase [Actinomycetota bacterium]